MNKSFLSSENLGTTKCPISEYDSNNKSEEGIFGALASAVLGPIALIALLAALCATVCGIQDAANKSFLKKCMKNVKKEDWDKLKEYCFNIIKGNSTLCDTICKKVSSLFPKSYSNFTSYPEFSYNVRGNIEKSINDLIITIAKGLKRGDDKIKTNVTIDFRDNNNYNYDEIDSTYINKKFDEDSKKANEYLDSLKGSIIPGTKLKIDEISYGYDYPDDNYIALDVDIVSIIDQDLKNILAPIAKTVKETKQEENKENK